MTTGMVIVGHRSHKEFAFIVKPSPGSRKLDLVAFQQIPEIQDMTFISNNHVQVKFGYDTFPYTADFEANGTVYHQDYGKNVDGTCQYRFIGGSELRGGTKYLGYDYYRDLYIVKYDENGIGNEVGLCYEPQS